MQHHFLAATRVLRSEEFFMNKQKSQYKFLGFLSMLYLVFFLSAAILAHKLVYFGHYMTSVSTFVLPFSFVLVDIIAEVYGYAVARKLIWSALVCEFVFATIMLLAVHLNSPGVLNNTDAYKEVFGTFMRIFIGNFIAMVGASFFNIYILVKWKFLLKGRYFWLRSLGSSGVGEFIFTFTCVLIAFVGVVPAASIPQLVVTSFLFKAIFNPIIVFPAAIFMNFLKKREGVDVYEYNINFSPFKLSSSKAE